MEQAHTTAASLSTDQRQPALLAVVIGRPGICHSLEQGNPSP